MGVGGEFLNSTDMASSTRFQDLLRRMNWVAPPKTVGRTDQKIHDSP